MGGAEEGSPLSANHCLSRGFRAARTTWTVGRGDAGEDAGSSVANVTGVTSPLVLHHGAFERLTDVALVGNALTLRVGADGVQQLLRNSQVEGLLLRPKLEMHRLEVPSVQIVRKILLEERFSFLIRLEYRKFLFHIWRSPSCACSAR